MLENIILASGKSLQQGPLGVSFIFHDSKFASVPLFVQPVQMVSPPRVQCLAPLAAEGSDD